MGQGHGRKSLRLVGQEQKEHGTSVSVGQEQKEPGTSEFRNRENLELLRQWLKEPGISQRSKEPAVRVMLSLSKLMYQLS